MKTIINLLINVGLFVGTLVIVFLIESGLLFLFTGELERISVACPSLHAITSSICLFVVFMYVSCNDNKDIYL
jgi:hypothetical protein